MGNQSNFKIISQEEFDILDECDQLVENVVYIVDKIKFYQKSKGKFYEEVTVTYVDENNNILHREYYLPHDQIKLYNCVLDISNVYNHIYKIYSEWCCNDTKVENIAPIENKIYTPLITTINLEKEINISFDVIEQDDNNYAHIISNRKFYIKEIFSSNYKFVPIVSYIINSETEIITIVTFDIVNLVNVSSNLSFNINIDLYTDEEFLNKFHTVPLKINVNVSNESTGD